MSDENNSKLLSILGAAIMAALPFIGRTCIHTVPATKQAVIHGAAPLAEKMAAVEASKVIASGSKVAVDHAMAAPGAKVAVEHGMATTLDDSIKPNGKSAVVDSILDNDNKIKQSNYQNEQRGAHQEDSIRTAKIDVDDGKPKTGTASHRVLVSTNMDDIKELPGEEIVKNELLSMSIPNMKLSKSPHILVAFPLDSTEYEKVYKKMPSASAEREMVKLKNKATIEGSPLKVAFYDKNASFGSEIAKLKDKDVVVIVGHSESDGGLLILPNGQSVTYAEIQTTCNTTKIRCIVLTCFSPDLSLNDQISTYDAIEMLNMADAKLKQQSNVNNFTVDQYILTLREARIQIKQKRAIIFSFSIPSGVAGLGGGSYLIVSRQQN